MVVQVGSDLRLAHGQRASLLEQDQALDLAFGAAEIALDAPAFFVGAISLGEQRAAHNFVGGDGSLHAFGFRGRLPEQRDPARASRHEQRDETHDALHQPPLALVGP